MTKDKYLTEFESLVESNKNSSYKSGYKHEISLSSDKHNKEVNKDGSKEERTEIKKKLIYAESTARHPHSEKEEGASAAIADNALTYAVRIGDPGLAYSSALVYEKLKRGSSPSTKRRLLKSIKNSRVKVNVGTLEKIEEFLKRNPSEEGGLVDKVSEKVAVFIFGIVAIAGILFGINSFTGATIGFNSAPSGFLGAVLFVGGIAGLFFSFKKS